MFTLREMVGLGGLEPPTLPLSGVRSNHLSYRPISRRVQLLRCLGINSTVFNRNCCPLYFHPIFDNNDPTLLGDLTMANLSDLESSLKQVDELIEKMEHSDLTLEQSLNHFEQGISLIKNCQKILQEAEQKVQILIQTSNNTTEELKPYEPGCNDE